MIKLVSPDGLKCLDSEHYMAQPVLTTLMPPESYIELSKASEVKIKIRIRVSATVREMVGLPVSSNGLGNGYGYPFAKQPNKNRPQNEFTQCTTTNKQKVLKYKMLKCIT